MPIVIANVSHSLAEANSLDSGSANDLSVAIESDHRVANEHRIVRNVVAGDGGVVIERADELSVCLLYTSPSPRD